MSVTVYLSPLTFILQYYTDLGVPLKGGKVFIYQASTSIPQSTYTDSTGTVQNANPIILAANGRLPSVAIWQPQGVAIKALFQDSSGNQIGTPIDSITGINDFTAGESAFANPASGSGADLVANAVRSYDVFASVRAANVPALLSGQTLIIEVEGGSAAGDGLGGAFWWNPSSSAADDGATVLKPTSLSGNGRYLRLVIPATSLPSSAPTITTGSFTGTFTGMSFATTSTVYWTLVKNNTGAVVVLTIPSGSSNSSNATTFTMTGLPSSLQPATRSPMIPIAQGAVEDNGGVAFNAAAYLQAGVGTITFLKNGSASGWTNSGTKGFTGGVDCSLVYSLQ